MGYSILGRVCLFILGLWWCWEVACRLRADMAEYRTTDLGGRAIMVAVWLATIVIVYLMVVHLAIPAARAVPQLF